MSADLWAAFGNGDDALDNPWSQPSPREERTQSQQSTLTVQESKQETLLVDKNDKQIPPAAQSPWGSKSTFSPIYGSNAASSLNDTTWIKHADTDGGWSDFVSPGETQDPWAASRALQTSEIIWDVDEVVKEDDDFGDFEAPLAVTTSAASNLAFSELSLGTTSSRRQTHDEHPTSLIVKAKGQDSLKTVQKARPKPDPVREAKLAGNSIGKVLAVEPKIERQTPIVVKSLLEDSEELWDEWSPDPISKTGFSNKSVPKAVSDQPRLASGNSITRSSALPSAEPGSQPIGAQSSGSSTSNLPPTNIPPPSILISLLSSLISTLPAQVETAMESFTSGASSSAAADKALSTAVRKCLAALRVAARIVAGRKVRWKRDTHLGQSMRIGPAVGGGKSGMKLTGIDRNETKREDREVAEFVGIWQNKLGNVRRALSSVNLRIGEPSSSNGTSGKKLELPIISEVMLIQTIKEEDGGVKSTKACALCGIKREERVDKVDIDVFDGFGEWWTDHWGHKECRAFWYQHEKYLQQR